MTKISSQNNFEVLSIPEEQVLSVLEEGEVPTSHNQISDEAIGLVEPLNSPVEGHSPTYAEMEKKRNLWTILAHLMKIPSRGHPKKGENLIRWFGRKKLSVLRCKEINPLSRCQ